jgi:hypothetical protein
MKVPCMASDEDGDAAGLSRITASAFDRTELKRSGNCLAAGGWHTCAPAADLLRLL